MASRILLGFGKDSVFLGFPSDVDLTTQSNFKVLPSDPGVEFEVDAINTWSWPLPLDQNGVLNDDVRDSLALLIAACDLRGVCKFRVQRILSSGKYVVFFVPSEHDNAEEVARRLGQAYNTSGDQLAKCGGCGVIQRISPTNPYMCRLGHFLPQMVKSPVPIPEETNVGFGWMSHNRDRRVDLLISCESDDETVSYLEDHISTKGYSFITSEQRDIESFIQASLSTRGGGIALVMMTNSYLTQSRTIKELACLCEIHTNIHLLVACIDLTKEQVLANPTIQQLCTNLSSQRFLTYSGNDSLKNQVLAELAEHVIPGYRRDQSYVALKKQLSERFSHAEPHVLAKLSASMGLTSIPVSFDDLWTQAELQNKLAEDQLDHLKRAIASLGDSNEKKAIQHYESKWLAEWTKNTAETPPLDKVAERAQQVFKVTANQ